MGEEITIWARRSRYGRGDHDMGEEITI